MKKINGLSFMEHIEKGVVILDGASGTTLQKRGLKPEDCPEQWAGEHPEEVIAMQKDYIGAGSQAVYTFTLGGNAIKLKEYGINDVYGLNKKLAEASAAAAQGRAFVGGDVGSTGLFLEPLGELGFEQAVDAFKEQIRGLYEGGADFIIIETMIDLAEARAALIAAKETCDLPVAVSMSFDENGRTLTGASPESAAIALIAAGADIIGVNCSTGPESMVKVAQAMKKVSNVPLIVKPNAGLPKMVNGETVFSMTAGDFSQYIKPLVQAGANLLGGCCGTNTEFIRAIARETKDITPLPPLSRKIKAVSCAANARILDKTVIAGTGLDASVNSAFAELLQNKDYDGVYDIVPDEQDKGAQLLLLHAPAEDEAEALIKVTEIASGNLKMPVLLKSQNPEAVEAFLRRYTGRVLVDPEGAEEKALVQIKASIRRYGAVLMAHSEAGKTEELLESIQREGFLPEDTAILLDAKDEAAALRGIKACTQKGVISAIKAGSASKEFISQAKDAGLDILFV